MAPEQIGHYRIASKLGEGGMGAVYRATDTRLNRDVAIKVLPPAFAADAARMQRFEREAQVLASLNHPNIAAIYGIEQGALVMELVEGPDLAGPLPVDTAIEYARQIAAGLEAAHEKGIVHRDLKPANIKVTPEGVVKLLDFGLAKATEASAAASVAASPTLSPTLSLAMTQAGMILGTAAYMAPEQARGKVVDRRADIWAFGVVLFEMLTGKQLFAAGDTATDIIAAVVTREPDWSLLPVSTPPHVRRLMARCLRKDPKLRLRDIGDARLALDEPDAPGPSAPVIAVPRPSALRRWAIPAIVVLIAVAAFWMGSRPISAPAARLMSLNVDLGADATTGRNLPFALSPDGARLAYLARDAGGRLQIAIRNFDQGKTTLLAGTEGAYDPFFSPDGQWLGFFFNGKLKKIPVQGGAAVPICDAQNARGADWSSDGKIVLTLNTATGLSLVPDSGGAPQTLTDPAGKQQRTHRWPQFLPGGGHILFTANASPAGFDDAEIDVLDLKTRQWKTVQRGGTAGRYLPSGHLVYVRQGVLYAIRFDLSRMDVSGAPVAIVQDLRSNATNGGGPFTVDAASSGTFIYLSGKPRDARYPIQRLDESGDVQPLLPSPASYIAPRLSRDGRQLAIWIGSLTAGDLFVFDIQRGTRTQLTDNLQSNLYPVWAADGKHLIFVSHTSDLYSIWWIRADGSGQQRKLLESRDALFPSSLSPDGRWLAYHQVGGPTGGDVWILPLDLSDPENPKPGKPEAFSQTSKSEAAPRFSPDGRWIAYSSGEGGGNEICVRPFPGPGGKWTVTNGGGDLPAWSPNGRDLFYVARGHLMALEYQTKGDTFLPGKARLWAASRTLLAGTRDFDVAPDGKHVVTFVNPESDSPSGNLHATFLMNFFDELKRRVP